MFTYKFKSKSKVKFLDEKQRFIIYKHTCLENGKYYIGQTNVKQQTNLQAMLERWKGHIKESRKKEPKFLFSKAIKKYGEQNWEHEILEELQTELFTNAAEIYWIDKFQSADKRYGYNLTFGGEGGIPNLETIEKISKSHKGKKLSEEHKQNISKTNLVICSTQEVRLKMSNNHPNFIGINHPMFGKHLTEESKSKISKSQKGKKLSEEHKRNLSIAGKIAQNKPEVKQHNSEVQKIAQNRPEVKEKRSKAMKGKKQTKEHIQKRLNSMKEFKHSQESKQKISQSKKGKCIGDKNHMYGKKLSIESIIKRTETRRKNKELKNL